MIFFENLNHPLARSVADACAAQGDEIFDVSASSGGLADTIKANGTPRALVLTPPERCEARVLRDGFADPAKALEFGQAIHNDAMQFLSDCRLATQAMMTAKAGHVLFLGIDDVAARLVGLPESPMANQLRVSALKSLAKEYGRMGIKYNAILSQPSKETVDPKTWRSQRDQLKVYTMRFSPNEIREYADFCTQAVQGYLPLNGGLLCLGKGVMEMAA
ncbi:hypothetical protein [Phaeobacter sp.]|uniref:hypothetical protein n=1 Tax=Phaeobacter sp. TaxID=1902409 RepID=UPI0025F0E0B6|nr:hypothetical protein [Phaeobacter sp.]